MSNGTAAPSGAASSVANSVIIKSGATATNTSPRPENQMSRASDRAECTINKLLAGRIAPTVRMIEDIAPALQIPSAALLVIAALAAEDGKLSQAGSPRNRSMQ